MTDTPASRFLVNGRQLRMYGNRMSVLPAAQFCPSAGRLSQQVGAGRSAAISSAWHARCAGAPEAARLLASLTPEEREQAESWPKPSPVTVGWFPGGHPHVELHYADAEKELLVGLDEMGFYADPLKEDCLTRGHLDFAWQLGPGYAAVADLKRSRYSSPGPWSLQLLAYGFAYAQKVGASAFLTGCWYAEEGEWEFAGEWVVLGSARAEELMQQVLHAAANIGTDLCFGPHCSGCYGWRACPSHAVPNPPELADIQDPTPAQAAEYLAHIAKSEKVLEAAKERIKRLVADGMRIEAGSKIYRAIPTKGREYYPAEDARAAGVKPKRGKDGVQYRWVNK